MSEKMLCSITDGPQYEEYLYDKELDPDEQRERTMTDGTGSGTTEQDYIRQIERLTTEVAIAESNFSESVDRHLKDVAEIERLQARVETLEGALERVNNLEGFPGTNGSRWVNLELLREALATL